MLVLGALLLGFELGLEVIVFGSGLGLIFRFWFKSYILFRVSLQAYGLG